MRYRFRKLSTGEKLVSVTGGLPVTIVESGSELLLDFQDETLSAEQETALSDLLAKGDLEFRERGEKLEISSS